MASVQIDEGELRRLLEEREALRAQVTAMQSASTAAVERSLSRAVRAFHVKFGHPVEHTPRVPDDAQVRFRAALITEEFIELLEAMFDVDSAHGMRDALERVQRAINGEYPFERAAVRFDLEAAYDAEIDLAWVIEGTHVVQGTRAEPGIAEVARANMEKDPAYVEAKDEHHRRPDPTKKPTKPAGWTPPNMRALLIDQGWGGA